jgi:hypothetical protein
MRRSKILFCSVALSAAVGGAQAFAADCYIDSNNGKDSNDGKSASTPVQTQAKIPSGCTTVHYARGSVFQEQLKIISGVKTYTNYTSPNGSASDPLPDFKFVTAPVVSAMSGGITLDGLKFEGTHNQGGSLSSLQSGGGICVYVGNNTTVQNCEVTDCDFAIFFAGGMGGTNTKSLATHNYVHDILGEAVDGAVGSDPNAVGGSKGIYVMTDNVEVSYNTIVNCVNYPQWTGASGSSKGGCDGGATEIAAASGGSVKGYRNHHNFAYNTCGFFQASTFFSNNSGTAAQTGTFEDSEFAYNVMIDTAWMVLAQVNNMNFVNMRWYNNTVVQHANSAGPVGDQGMLMEMWNGTSSGVSTGGSTPANQIFLTNNLMVLYGVSDSYDFNASYKSSNSLANNSAIVMKTNIFLPNTKTNPGFIKIGDGKTVPSATDFDLTSDTIALDGSNPTISGGTPIDGQTLDFLNRAVPSNGKVDIGAFQYGSVAVDGGVASSQGGSGAGGSSGAKGGAGGSSAPASGSGGSSSPVTGKGGTFGGTAPATGGSGGAVAGTGGASGTSAGGASGSGGTPAKSTSSGGNSGSSGGAQSSGGSGSGGSHGSGGTSGGTSTAATGAGSSGGCSCSLGQSRHRLSGLWIGILGIAALIARRRVRR